MRTGATSTHDVDRAGRAAWAGLFVLMVPVFMTAVDMSVLFLAMPAIAADLLPSGTQQLWALHIGDIAGASLVLAAGRAVDRFGPRRLLVLGLVCYGLASSVAAVAPTTEVLILARTLLGASAVTIAPAAAALLRGLFPRARHFSVAIALLMAAFSGGMALGPPLGGLVLEHLWWGAIFLFNVPIAIGVLCALRLLPRIDGTRRGRIDIVSIVLSALGIFGLVYGAQEIAAQGWNGWRVFFLVCGVSLIGLFVARQRRVADPLFDLALFRSAPFSLGLISIWLVISASAGADLQLPQHLQVVIGMSPAVAGLLLVVPALLSMLATASAPVLLRWFRPGAVIGAGALLSISGAALMLFTIADGPRASVTLLMLAAGVVAVGVAPVFAIGTNIILANAPASQTGSAQSMQEVSGSLGNTTGLALGGSVAYLGYSRAMHDTMPDAVPDATARQSVESVGGAIAGTEDLTPALAEQLMDAAATAFTTATRDTYLLAIVGFALLAVLAFWGLRNARVDADPALVPDSPSSDAAFASRNIDD